MDMLNIAKKALIITCTVLTFIYGLCAINYQVYGEYQYVVFIHAGHGGAQNVYSADGKLLIASDPGAEVNGIYEKDLNLIVAKKVAKLLEGYSPKLKVVMARDTDTFYNFANVTADAKKNHATLTLCIHHNFFKDSNINGTETYYYNANSVQFANNIQESLTKNLGFRDRGLRWFDYTSIKTPTTPTVLAEIGYMTNNSDFSTMTNPKTQDIEAEALKDAIIKTLGI